MAMASALTPSFLIARRDDPPLPGTRSILFAIAASPDALPIRPPPGPPPRSPDCDQYFRIPPRLFGIIGAFAAISAAIADVFSAITGDVTWINSSLSGG
jgi:hypothetical protein